MNFQHQGLADGGWAKFSLMEQLANVGSEVERTMKSTKKADPVLAEKSLVRALELLDLTIQDPKNRYRLKEVVRSKELLADYFLGENQYGCTDKIWHKYFEQFTIAANKGRRV